MHCNLNEKSSIFYHPKSIDQYRHGSWSILPMIVPWSVRRSFIYNRSAFSLSLFVSSLLLFLFFQPVKLNVSLFILFTFCFHSFYFLAHLLYCIYSVLIASPASICSSLFILVLWLIHIHTSFLVGRLNFSQPVRSRVDL